MMLRPRLSVFRIPVSCLVASAAIAQEVYAGTLNQVGGGSWLEREVLAQIEKGFRKQDRLDDLSAQLKKLALAYP